MSSDEIKLLKEQIKTYEHQLKMLENHLFILQNDFQFSQKTLQIEYAKQQNQITNLASLILEIVKDNRHLEEVRENNVLHKINSIINLDVAGDFNSLNNVSTVNNEADSLGLNPMGSMGSGALQQQMSNQQQLQQLQQQNMQNLQSHHAHANHLQSHQGHPQLSSHDAQRLHRQQQQRAAAQRLHRQQQQRAAAQHAHQQHQQQLQQRSNNSQDPANSPNTPATSTQGSGSSAAGSAATGASSALTGAQHSSLEESRQLGRKRRLDGAEHAGAHDEDADIDGPAPAGSTGFSTSVSLGTSHNSELSKTPKIYDKDYAFIKAPSTVEEIWNEYSVGLNNQPSIRELEAEYKTGWRRDPATSKKFNRRKSIYKAIERGLQKGYRLNECIEFLENYRFIDSEKNLKQPIGWLCHGNIPPQLK